MQSLYDADADNLKAWWLKCPRKQVTTLDTHDGIPVIDCGDLMTRDQTERTKERLLNNGANVNDRYNPLAESNEVYQARLTVPVTPPSAAIASQVITSNAEHNWPHIKSHRFCIPVGAAPTSTCFFNEYGAPRRHHGCVGELC